MKISVYFTPLGVTQHDVSEKPVVVIDVLRTTTTVVAAMANGAKAVLPSASQDEALRHVANLERDAVVLAGERKLERIEGFQLGNSPLEMTEDVVRGKTVVMSTTNGTPAITAAESGAPVMIAAVTNFSAAVAKAQEAFEKSQEIVILCSGRDKMFALEDAYAAGRFVRALVPGSMRRTTDFNDAAIAAYELVRRYGEKWKRAIAASAAAKELRKRGFKADLTAATEVDIHDIVPVYSGKLITLPD